MSRNSLRMPDVFESIRIDKVYDHSPLKRPSSVEPNVLEIEEGAEPFRGVVSEPEMIEEELKGEKVFLHEDEENRCLQIFNPTTLLIIGRTRSNTLNIRLKGSSLTFKSSGDNDIHYDISPPSTNVGEVSLHTETVKSYAEIERERKDTNIDRNKALSFFTHEGRKEVLKEI